MEASFTKFHQTITNLYKPSLYIPFTTISTLLSHVLSLWLICPLPTSFLLSLHNSLISSLSLYLRISKKKKIMMILLKYGLSVLYGTSFSLLSHMSSSLVYLFFISLDFSEDVFLGLSSLRWLTLLLHLHLLLSFLNQLVELGSHYIQVVDDVLFCGGHLMNLQSYDQSSFLKGACGFLI